MLYALLILRILHSDVDVVVAGTDSPLKSFRYHARPDKYVYELSASSTGRLPNTDHIPHSILRVDGLLEKNWRCPQVRGCGSRACGPRNSITGGTRNDPTNNGLDAMGLLEIISIL